MTLMLNGKIKYMTIEKQVLSIEQMKHLQELGVDTSDASVYWVRAKRIIGKQRNDFLDNEMGKWRLSLSKSIVLPAAWAVESVPTYTIGDIIEKLPIRIGSVNRKIYFTGKYIIVSYSSPDGSLIEYRGTTLLCLLYSLLCWVAETHKELLEVKK